MKSCKKSLKKIPARGLTYPFISNIELNRFIILGSFLSKIIIPFVDSDLISDWRFFRCFDWKGLVSIRAVSLIHLSSDVMSNSDWRERWLRQIVLIGWRRFRYNFRLLHWQTDKIFNQKWSLREPVSFTSKAVLMNHMVFNRGQTT